MRKRLTRKLVISAGLALFGYCVRKGFEKKDN